MNTLAFEIRPSPDTPDHEVRVRVDGRDLLDGVHIGVDPPEFFGQFAGGGANRLVIGRCACGLMGCDDTIVLVERGAYDVIWRAQEEFRFDRAHYEDAVRGAANDFSWEDAKRRAERLVGGILRGARTPDGFAFEWASARIAPLTIGLGFTKGGERKMLKFGWDGATDTSAIQGAKHLKRQLMW